jgi:8-oxo-dGTP diphosphatase
MRKGTVCFFINGDKVLLVLIEYSPTDSKWTGIGGMVDGGESLEDCVVREIQEESYIEVDKESLKKMAELNEPTFQLNVFLADNWSGELKAKEPSLKKFEWFSKYNLPWSQMHKGNETWLPKVLDGKIVRIENGRMTEVSGFEVI